MMRVFEGLSFKKTCLFTFLVSVIFFGAGFCSSLSLGDVPDNYNYLREALDGSLSNKFFDLFFHNLKVNISCVFFGALTGGIYTLNYLFLNFFSMGLIVSHLKKEHTWLATLSTFVLHGVFELPAMVLSAAAGFYIPIKTIQMFRNKKIELKEVKKIVYIIAAVIALTLIAATVEVFVSPHFMKI